MNGQFVKTREDALAAPANVVNSIDGLIRSLSPERKRGTKVKKKIAATFVVCAIGFATTRAFSQNVDLASIRNRNISDMLKSSLAKIHNRRVRYVAPSRMKVFPAPVVVWAKAGLASEAQKCDILNTMVYPLINEDRYAIAAIVIDFYNDDRKSFGVSVLYHDRGSNGVGPDDILFKWNEQGKVNKNDYKEFLEPLPDG